MCTSDRYVPETRRLNLPFTLGAITSALQLAGAGKIEQIAEILGVEPVYDPALPHYCEVTEGRRQALPYQVRCPHQIVPGRQYYFHYASGSVERLEILSEPYLSEGVWMVNTKDLDGRYSGKLTSMPLSAVGVVPTVNGWLWLDSNRIVFANRSDYKAA